jgi:hypothetical protein
VRDDSALFELANDQNLVFWREAGIAVISDLPRRPRSLDRVMAIDDADASLTRHEREWRVVSPLGYAYRRAGAASETPPNYRPGIKMLTIEDGKTPFQFGRLRIDPTPQ